MFRSMLLACLLAQTPNSVMVENLELFLLENFGRVHGYYSEFKLDSVRYAEDGSGEVVATGSSWIQYRFDGTNHYIKKTREGAGITKDNEVIAWYNEKVSELVHDEEGYHALTDGVDQRYFDSKSLLLSPRTVLKFSPLLDFPSLEELFAELKFITAYERDYTVLSFYWKSRDRFLEFYLDKEGALRRFEYCERPLPEGRPDINEPPRGHLEELFPGDPFDLKIASYRIDYDDWSEIGGVQFPIQATYTQSFPVEWERSYLLRQQIAQSQDPEEILRLSIDRYMLKSYIIIENHMAVATFQVNPELTKEDFMIDYPPGTVFAYWHAEDIPLPQPPSYFDNVAPTKIALTIAIALSVLSAAGLLFLFWNKRRNTSGP